jgi:hypothetical protein
VELQNKSLSDPEKREIGAFLLGDPIGTVQDRLFVSDTTKIAKKKALEWAEKLGEKRILRDDIGVVVFNKNGVKNSLDHRIYQNKLNSLPLVPEVVKKGKIIEISDDFDGKNQKNIYLAAPVQVGQNKDILFIRLRKNAGYDTRFYIHEIFDLEEIKKMSDAVNTRRQPGTSPSRSIAHIKSILSDILNVKD